MTDRAIRGKLIRRVGRIRRPVVIGLMTLQAIRVGESVISVDMTIKTRPCLVGTRQRKGRRSMVERRWRP